MESKPRVLQASHEMSKILIYNFLDNYMTLTGELENDISSDSPAEFRFLPKNL